MAQQTGESALRIPSTNLPWVESPFFDRELERRRHLLSAEAVEMARGFHRDGFLLLPQIVPHDLVDRVRSAAEVLYQDPEIAAARRVQDAWAKGADAVRELAISQPIQDRLRVLYEREPIPFQTLNFKWGSEQRGHSDSIHFSCLPARFMCGVWVALEDTHEANGPLFYYPGSHRLPEVTAYDLGQTVEAVDYKSYEDYQHELVKELGLEPLEFHARKGDALVWSSNVIHGGTPMKDKNATRWSQVTHYYFDSCIYYTPMLSDMPTGDLQLKSILNLNTMRPVEHSYNGEPVSIRTGRHGRSHMSRTSTLPRAYRLRPALAAAQNATRTLRQHAGSRLGHPRARLSAMRRRLERN